MKIAIWGSYNYGNYGDDIMAIQFANYIKESGGLPVVYRLNNKLASQYQIETTNSINDLLNDAKFCIIGGGGMLVGQSKKINSVSIAFDNDFKELHQVSLEKQCKVFPISVGGDGRGSNTPLPFWQKEFWSGAACSDSTVRLKEDVSLVNQLGKNTTYYPDILFSVSDFWDIGELSEDKNQIKVGINIGNSWKSRLLAFQLNNIAYLKKNIVFYFISTHSPNALPNYELLPKIKSPYVKHHVYKDPLSTLEFIKSLDLIVSSKLHLGLTALALNVPFYSFNGAGKTKTFLKSINAGFAIYNSKDIVRLISNITNVDKILNAKTQFEPKILQQCRTDSQGHMNFLKNLISNYA